MNDEVKDIWNANAEFWDGKMGEGNNFHKQLIEPIQLKLLNIVTGMKILDVACGNGQFARKMAGLGAHVTAVDFSEKFIALAKSKESKNISYGVLDATSDADLDKLPSHNFDALVCTMALMDMSDIEVLARHAPGLLKKHGVFVFSILHPCFNSGKIMLMHEMDDLSGRLENRYYVRVRDYLVETSQLGIGMAGQPKSQYYFHRPVSALLGVFFKNGFVLDAFEEPSFKDIGDSERIFDNVYKTIPPALVCRLKMVGSLPQHRVRHPGHITEICGLLAPNGRHDTSVLFYPIFKLLQG
jgi:SAM-dependent methyltransferase